jgi:hypothetical protein
MAKRQEPVDDLLDALVWMRRKAKKKVAKGRAVKKAKGKAVKKKGKKQKRSKG